jgi:hypothetical protein
VGDGQTDEPKGKCGFSGNLDLELLRLTQAGILKVECPVCYAIWTVRMRGNEAVFPTHPPRRTRLSRAISRWVKQGEVWTLSEPPR